MLCGIGVVVDDVDGVSNVGTDAVVVVGVVVVGCVVGIVTVVVIVVDVVIIVVVLICMTAIIDSRFDVLTYTTHITYFDNTKHTHNRTVQPSYPTHYLQI